MSLWAHWKEVKKKMNKIRKAFFEKFKNQTHLEELTTMKREFKTVYNEKTNVTEMTIYGVIGESWWEDSTSASDIDFALKETQGDIVINLNSPGGDAFDGIAIYNRLKNHDGKVTINIDGYACSAASVIAMAADELWMGEGTMLMIHEASTMVWGNKRDMRKEADILEELENGIIDIYMTKANITREEIREMVDNETWFSKQAAIDIGFSTSTERTVEEPTPAQNTADDDFINTIVEKVTAQLQKTKNDEPMPKPEKVAVQRRVIF